MWFGGVLIVREYKKKEMEELSNLMMIEITRAIFLAASEVAKEENGLSYEMSEELTQRVIKILNSKFRDEVPGVEDIQDVVVKVLIEGGHARTSEKYIAYRNEK